MILNLPLELHIQLLTFLRAKDLSVLQETCRAFNDPNLIHAIIDTFATYIYPPELCEGFDTPAIAGDVGSISLKNNYEALRNMEMLVVARILSRPEPSLSPSLVGNATNRSAQAKAAGYYYVSKAWCRDTLKYLNAQTEKRRKIEEQREQQHLADLEAAAIAEAKAAAAATGKKMKYVHKQKFKTGANRSKKTTKKSKRKERMKSKNIALLPPTLDVNDDITCVHNCLKPCGSERTSRAKRRLMDKQAWKVIKKLYPNGVQLNLLDGECLQCVMEAETEKKNEELMKVKAAEERKAPLSCPLVRGFYNRRTTGVPKNRLVSYQQEEARKVASPIPVAKKTPLLRNGAVCPLVPGVYNVLPRAWCHRWRKYIKTGEGGRPPAPDASGILCDGHRLPLIPPHLELYINGETSALLDISAPLRSSLDVHVAQIPTSPFASASASIRSNNGEDLNETFNGHSPAQTSLPVGFAPVSQQLGGSGSGSGRPRSASVATATATAAAANAFPRSNSSMSMTSRSSSLSLSLDHHEIHSLRTNVGLSEAELQLQQFAMMQIEEQRNRELQMAQRRIQQQQQQAAHRFASLHDSDLNRSNGNGNGNGSGVDGNDTPLSPEEVRSRVNAQLDRENKVVVEILTDEEVEALERWWPGIHSCYALKFAVVESPEHGHGHGHGRTDIVWTTDPCRECDASGRCRDLDFVARNRCRSWINNTPKKKY